MRILLDTMAFLWWVTDDRSLPDKVRKVVSDPENLIFFSAASAWEIVIKAKLGKLKLKQTAARFVRRHLQKNDISGLAIDVSHALHVYKLPDIHRDPFDRILIAQAQLERMDLATNDEDIQKYDVSIMW